MPAGTVNVAINLGMPHLKPLLTLAQLLTTVGFVKNKNHQDKRLQNIETN